MVSEDEGVGPSLATSSIGASATLAFVSLLDCQPAAMAAIFFFCLDERLSQTALELEEAMASVVQRGEMSAGGWMQLWLGLKF